MYKENIKKYCLYAVCIIVFIALIVGCYYLYNSEEPLDNELITTSDTTTITQSTTTTVRIDESFYVDVKGAIKKPGVYEFNEGDKIIDAINKAGGLLKTANTSNINLAKKLSSEMVVYIFTNKELTTKKNNTTTIPFTIETIEINNCVVSTTTTKEIITTTEETNKLININNASLEELMTIPGIGESKALSIINYRKENTFNTIEDIKNVSGIGDSLFAKIKDYITV